MDVKKLSEPLPDSEIDIRIQSIFKSGWAIFLAYKTARADARRLDDVIGPMHWQKKYYQDGKANTVCSIDIWDKTKKSWVSKEDVGEDNNQGCKGTYSDAFKRAGFAWGIGRELYDLPVLFVKLADDEFQECNGKYKPTNKLKVTSWKFKRIVTNEDTKVLIYDHNNSVRFNETMEVSEEKTIKSNMNNSVHGMYLESIDMCFEIEDLTALWFEMSETYVIPDDIIKLFTFRKEAINNGEVLRYEDKNGEA